MVKELSVIRDGGGKILGCSTNANQAYYYYLTLDILKYFSVFQVDNKIIVTHEDVEHIDRIEISRFSYGSGFYLDIYYNLFVHTKLIVLDDEIPSSLKYDWEVTTESNLRETIFTFN